jgi:hypothetical protein
MIPSQININSNNIRQMLIEKLRKSRKTQRLPPKINTNTFDNYSNPTYLEPKLSSSEFDHTSHTSLPVNTNKFPENIVNDAVTPSIIYPDKPYGILKNGTKPTYKTWNLSQKNYDSVVNEEVKNNVNTVTQIVENVINPVVQTTLPIEIPHVKDLESPSQPMIQQREIKKTYSIGKNKKSKSVGVLIKNIHTRKKIEDDILKHKKTNITTVKNYLKSHNMIKHGTSAPTNLLRTMYEHMKLCGDVSNDNINNLIHNFEKD